MSENLKIKGIVTIKRYDKNHNLFDVIQNKNLIVNSGLDFFTRKITDLLLEDDEVIYKIVIGNGLKTPELTDTDSPLLSSDQISQNVVKREAEQDVRFLNTKENKEIYAECLFSESDTLLSADSVTDIALFTNKNRLIARTVLNPDQFFDKRDDEYLSISWNIIIG